VAARRAVARRRRPADALKRGREKVAVASDDAGRPFKGVAGRRGGREGQELFAGARGGGASTSVGRADGGGRSQRRTVRTPQPRTCTQAARGERSAAVRRTRGGAQPLRTLHPPENGASGKMARCVVLRLRGTSTTTFAGTLWRQPIAAARARKKQQRRQRCGGERGPVGADRVPQPSQRPLPALKTSQPAWRARRRATPGGRDARPIGRAPGVRGASEWTRKEEVRSILSIDHTFTGFGG
jgi:hypothetical protein